MSIDLKSCETGRKVKIGAILTKSGWAASVFVAKLAPKEYVVSIEFPFPSLPEASSLEEIIEDCSRKESL